MQLSKHFTLAEMTASATAAKRGLSNVPSAVHVDHLIQLCNELLEPARDILDRPMIVLSGYRSDVVNAAVGGAKNSAHKHGWACDFRCPAFGAPDFVVRHLVREFRRRGIKFDQIINEFNNWVHIGLYRADGTQRGQVLQAVKIGGITHYKPMRVS